MVSDKDSRLSYLKGNVSIITITWSIEQFSRMASFPYLSLFILALGGNAQSIGLISSLRTFASLFTYPLAGYFADRMDRIKMIVFWTYLITAVYGFYVFATGWVMIAVGTFIMGFIIFQLPPKSAILADSLDPKHRGTGFALTTTIPEAISVFSPYLAGYFIDQVGASIAVRYLYALHMFMLFTSTTIDWRFLKDTVIRKETKIALSTIPRLLKDAYSSAVDVMRWAPKDLKAFSVVVGIGLVANAVASPFWVVYATKQIGLTTTEWGLIFLFYTVVKIVTFFPAGTIIDRFGKRKVMLSSFTLSLAPLLYFVRIRGFTDALITMLVLAFANAFSPSASSALIVDMTPKEMRGKVMAAFGRGAVQVDPRGGTGGGPQVGYVFSLPITIGSILGGYIYAINPTYPFIAQFILTIIGLVINFFFVHEPEKVEI